MAGLGFSELLKRKNLEVLTQKIKAGESFPVVNDKIIKIIYGPEVKIAKHPKLISNLEKMVNNQKLGLSIGPRDLNRQYLPSEKDNEEVYASLFKPGIKELYSVKLPLEEPIIKTKQEIEEELKKFNYSEKKIKDAFASLKRNGFSEGDNYQINTIYTGKLLKTSEFGGKESQSHLKKEIIAFDQLNDLLNKATNNGGNPITIHVIDSFKKEIMLLKNVKFAIRTPGSKNLPISDFEIKNSSNETVAYISHKWGTEPTDFGQYSGVTQRGRNKIFNHEETNKFVESIKEWLRSISIKFGNGDIQKYIEAGLVRATKRSKNTDTNINKSTSPYNDSVIEVKKDIPKFNDSSDATISVTEEIFLFPRGITVSKEIKDPDLKKMAMFGQDIIDGERGENAVDFLAQGTFFLTPREDGDWDLTAYKLISSKEDIGNIEEKYQPMFIARFEAARKNFGILGCRISIYSKEGRKMTQVISEENDNPLYEEIVEEITEEILLELISNS